MRHLLYVIVDETARTGCIVKAWGKGNFIEEMQPIAESHDLLVYRACSIAFGKSISIDVYGRTK